MTPGRSGSPDGPGLDTSQPAPAAAELEPVEPPEPVVVPLAERVAEAVLAVPGVTGLRGGSFGIGTYLPGRRVPGIRLGEVCEVHVAVEMGSRVPAVASAITAAVAPLAGTAVEVYVEDVTALGEAADGPYGEPGPD